MSGGGGSVEFANSGRVVVIDESFPIVIVVVALC